MKFSMFRCSLSGDSLISISMSILIVNTFRKLFSKFSHFFASWKTVFSQATACLYYYFGTLLSMAIGEFFELFRLNYYSLQ